jgi:hypothetical protein
MKKMSDYIKGQEYVFSEKNIKACSSWFENNRISVDSKWTYLGVSSEDIYMGMHTFYNPSYWKIYLYVSDMVPARPKMSFARWEQIYVKV